MLAVLFIRTHWLGPMVQLGDSSAWYCPDTDSLVLAGAEDGQLTGDVFI